MIFLKNINAYKSKVISNNYIVENSKYHVY